MFRRGNGWFYSEDVITRQQLSLRTKDRKKAQVLLSVKNEAYQVPMMNLMLARTYLREKYPELISRTWGDVIDYLIEGLEEGISRQKWERIKSSNLLPDFDLRHCFTRRILTSGGCLTIRVRRSRHSDGFDNFGIMRWIWAGYFIRYFQRELGLKLN